jgi:hypothetical protein
MIAGTFREFAVAPSPGNPDRPGTIARNLIVSNVEAQYMPSCANQLF